MKRVPEYVTRIELRQENISWDVALESARAACETLAKAGYRVALKPTLLSEMVDPDPPEVIERFLNGSDGDDE